MDAADEVERRVGFIGRERKRSQARAAGTASTKGRCAKAHRSYLKCRNGRASAPVRLAHMLAAGQSDFVGIEPCFGLHLFCNAQTTGSCGHRIFQL